MRPELNKNISIEDFRDFYWLKKELMEFCRNEQINSSGSKVEIAKRIEKYLETGIREETKIKTKSISKFDWKNKILNLETIITDSYRNTENVRSFFILNIGTEFKFNVEFMNWMKSNIGKTLQDAINQWKEIKLKKKNNKNKKK